MKKWRRRQYDPAAGACLTVLTSLLAELDGVDVFMNWVWPLPDPAEWYVALEKEIAPGVWNVETDTEILGTVDTHLFTGPFDPGNYRGYVRNREDGSACGVRSEPFEID